MPAVYIALAHGYAEGAPPSGFEGGLLGWQVGQAGTLTLIP